MHPTFPSKYRRLYTHRRECSKK